MMRNCTVLLLILAVLSGGFSSASAIPPPASEYDKLILFSHFLLCSWHALLQICHLLSTQFFYFFFHPHIFAEIISGVVSNVVSALVKWLWSLKSTTKNGIDLSLAFPVLFPISMLLMWNLDCFLKCWSWWSSWVQFSAVSSSRSMMKFEDGYTVETVFDGSKMGIEPYSVEASPSGELLVLDSENSNIYKISTPLSRCKLSFVICILLVLFNK